MGDSDSKLEDDPKNYKGEECDCLSYTLNNLTQRIKKLEEKCQ